MCSILGTTTIASSYSDSDVIEDTWDREDVCFTVWRSDRGTSTPSMANGLGASGHGFKDNKNDELERARKARDALVSPR